MRSLKVAASKQFTVIAVKGTRSELYISIIASALGTANCASTQKKYVNGMRKRRGRKFRI